MPASPPPDVSTGSTGSFASGYLAYGGFLEPVRLWSGITMNPSDPAPELQTSDALLAMLTAPLE